MYSKYIKRFWGRTLRLVDGSGKVYLESESVQTVTSSMLATYHCTRVMMVKLVIMVLVVVLVIQYAW